jgi:hypothetical protein
MNSLHLNLCPNGLTRKLGTSARFYLFPLPPSKPSRPREIRLIVHGSPFIVKPQTYTMAERKIVGVRFIEPANHLVVRVSSPLTLLLFVQGKSTLNRRKLYQFDVFNLILRQTVDLSQAKSKDCQPQTNSHPFNPFHPLTDGRLTYFNGDHSPMCSA